MRPFCLQEISSFLFQFYFFTFRLHERRFPIGWLVGWLVLLFLFRPERNLQQGREITYLKVLIKSATHCDDSTKFLSFKTSLIKFYMEARRKNNYLKYETKNEKMKNNKSSVRSFIVYSCTFLQK
jgi:hypothetical protein